MFYITGSVNKFLKSIRLFFLLLAGLAITAHLVIPHDHHMISTVSGQHESCPASGNKTGHHQSFPVHCHAFNDLAADKLASVFSVKSIPSGFISVIWSDDLNISDIPETNEPVTDTGRSLPFAYISRYYSLRAPPSLI
jgi:hypothetical protein